MSALDDCKALRPDFKVEVVDGSPTPGQVRIRASWTDPATNGKKVQTMDVRGGQPTEVRDRAIDQVCKVALRQIQAGDG